MDFLSIAIFISVTIFFVQYLGFFVTRSSKNLPPGPNPLPIIGSLHLIGDQPHRSMFTLANKYGPLMALKLGQITTIVISSSTMAKEVLQKQDLAFSSNRTVPNALLAIDYYNYSLGFLPIGPKWTAIRKTMTSFVFSNNKINANKHLRMEKVQEFIEYCFKCSQKGEAVSIGLGAFITSLNLLSNTIFSKDIVGWNSDNSREFYNLVRNFTMEGGKPNLADFFPVFGRFDPQGIRHRTAIVTTKLHIFAEKLVDERLEQRKQGLVMNDMLDVLLDSMETNPEDMDKQTIVYICQDMFVAGTDASSNTVEWAISEAVKNPDIMRKAKEELAHVIGKGKTIEEDDVDKLPYLRCVVKETFRLHPVAPFLIPRKVRQNDVQLSGFTIPKGSQVLVNAYAIGRDPSIWESPLEFKPERFWNSEIDVRGQHFELIPFGAGRRICPGLPLGLKMVHLMLGSLLNSFDWKLQGDIVPKTLNMDERFGMILQRAEPLLVVPVIS
ncbi:oxygenase [Lithospermum erythrorhizon]|uniref:Oxygenase n=1 Tax=Lithospermum erythrorhizon TaxID=34254 RepID=A0AAV3QBG3_LITER